MKEICEIESLYESLKNVSNKSELERFMQNCPPAVAVALRGLGEKKFPPPPRQQIALIGEENK